MGAQVPEKLPPYNSKAWLWKLAGVFLIIGGGVTWFNYTHRIGIEIDHATRVSILGTVIVVGLCIISATAHRMIRR
jgi:hypothetical protein